MPQSLLCVTNCCYYIPTKHNKGRGGILDSPCPSVCMSVCLSVWKRHGFWSVTQVCFGISNFICMLSVSMGRSLLIFTDITFKMAVWWPYWIFRFPVSNFILASNVRSKLQWRIICVYTGEPIDFKQCNFPKWLLGGHIGFAIFGLCRWNGLLGVTEVCFGVSISNFTCMLFVAMGRSLCIVSDINIKMAAWRPQRFFLVSGL